MLSEFKEFIAKGNVMDLAVGVIIGGAFGLIVSSLVDDIIMPVVGAIFGGFAMVVVLAVPFCAIILVLRVIKSRGNRTFMKVIFCCSKESANLALPNLHLLKNQRLRWVPARIRERLT